ncbi:MAG: hypothetical protein AAFV88_23635, partial [Planctomycetota bacterium]
HEVDAVKNLNIVAIVFIVLIFSFVTGGGALFGVLGGFGSSGRRSSPSRSYEKSDSVNETVAPGPSRENPFAQ